LQGELKELQGAADLSAQRLDRAAKLIAALGDESIRWKVGGLAAVPTSCWGVGLLRGTQLLLCMRLLLLTQLNLKTPESVLPGLALDFQNCAAALLFLSCGFVQ
jgi:hypothetical protein